MSELSYPLADMCETCPVRELINPEVAHLVGSSSIGTNVGAWERFSDGEHPPIRLKYAQGDIDDGNIARKLKTVAQQERESCEGKVTAEHGYDKEQKDPLTQLAQACGALRLQGTRITIDATDQRNVLSRLWRPEIPAGSPEVIRAYLSQDPGDVAHEPGWYVSSGYSMTTSYEYPFTDNTPFTVREPLTGAIAHLARGANCQFATDTASDGTKVAAVTIPNYASVYFSYKPMEQGIRSPEDYKELVIQQQEALQAEGLHMLLNGWDIKESAALEQDIEGIYAQRRADISAAIEHFMGDQE